MATGTSEQRPKDKAYSDWQVGKNLGACMKELYVRNLWTDVRFRCKDHGEEEEIHAHKIVLAARSHVFLAMFYGANAEAKNDVKLKDAEKKILDLFFRYVYTDNVILEEEDEASELLQMAHLYQVPSLVQLCADYLEKNIKIRNVCEMLTPAECYQIKTLKEACYTYIDQNATAVINSLGLMDLSKECLLHILKGDTFYAAEEAILARTEEWASKRLNEQGLEQNGANFRNVLGELFYHLRLPTLSYQELVRGTRNKDYLSTEEFMNISDFINGIPGTSVTSNSTVARAPMMETLAFNVGDEYYNTFYYISCQFEMLVSRNLKLLEFGLCDIIPYLNYSGRLFTCSSIDEYGHVDLNDSSSLDEFASKYMEPSKTVSFIMYNRHFRSKQRKVFECQPLNEINLPDCFSVVAHGSLTVDRNTHDFKIDVSKTSSPTVVLTNPLVLEKKGQPYKCSIAVEIPRYGGDFSVQMKTRLTKNQYTIISNTGSVRVSVSSDSFLKNIKIQTLANRFEDNSEESETMYVQ